MSTTRSIQSQLEQQATSTRQQFQKAETIYNKADIEKALDRMAAEIKSKFGSEPITLLVLMMGGMITAGHLATRLEGMNVQFDSMDLSRYGTSETGQDEIIWRHKPRHSLKNKTIIVTDDVIDGGVTLQEAVKYCRNEGATAVYTAVMVNKVREREKGCDITPDFEGLKCDGKAFLVGFGLDKDYFLRNEFGIYAMPTEPSAQPQQHVAQRVWSTLSQLKSADGENTKTATAAEQVEHVCQREWSNSNASRM